MVQKPRLGQTQGSDWDQANAKAKARKLPCCGIDHGECTAILHRAGVARFSPILEIHKGGYRQAHCCLCNAHWIVAHVIHEQCRCGSRTMGLALEDLLDANV